MYIKTLEGNICHVCVLHECMSVCHVNVPVHVCHVCMMYDDVCMLPVCEA